VTTTPSPSLPRELQKEVEETFALYPRLAARVTNLRTIIQNPESFTSADTALWVEDVKSVTTDFLTLIGNTRDLIRRILKDQEQS